MDHAGVVRVGSLTIDAGVVFCDPWPLSFQILGQEDFPRHARITISANESWFDLSKETHDENGLVEPASQRTA